MRTEVRPRPLHALIVHSEPTRKEFTTSASSGTPIIRATITFVQRTSDRRCREIMECTALP